MHRFCVKLFYLSFTDLKALYFTVVFSEAHIFFSVSFPRLHNCQIQKPTDVQTEECWSPSVMSNSNKTLLLIRVCGSGDSLPTHIHIANVNVDLCTQGSEQVPKDRTNDGYGLDTALKRKHRKYYSH